MVGVRCPVVLLFFRLHFSCWFGVLRIRIRRFCGTVDAHFGSDEMEGGEDESRPEFACPFCCEDFDVVGLCVHIDDEHPVEAKNGVWDWLVAPLKILEFVPSLEFTWSWFLAWWLVLLYSSFLSSSVSWTFFLYLLFPFVLEVFLFDFRWHHYYRFVSLEDVANFPLLIEWKIVLLKRLNAYGTKEKKNSVVYVYLCKCNLHCSSCMSLQVRSSLLPERICQEAFRSYFTVH